MVAKSFVLYYQANGLSHNRLGVCAGKDAIGNAVARNRAKRLLREAYRQNRPNFRPGFDFILVARKNLLNLKAPELIREFRNCLFSAGLIIV
ncbi:MAG: ribonuclease P protein component [Candidatus Schekmanbacteria bacterium]|nr:ribonuclease P protein component [Candidatus Schekmanbacteria bacterium]